MILRALPALLALLILTCAHPATAVTLTEGPLSAVVPETLTEGQPFLVEVTLTNQVEKVSVEWLGKATEVVMSRRDNVFKGDLLLGAGLGIKPGSYTLLVEAVRAGRRELVLGKVQVSAGDFPEQSLSLPAKMVTPSKEDLARIKREQVVITQALGQFTARRFWSFPFLRPVPGEVTGAFGLQRILNGQPRAPHSGVDFEAALGDEVHAANQGRVILSGDFFFNGKSVFVDHGQGVITMYFHLSRIDVSSGQYIERGHVVGLVGATGRATGPHLHFGMKILDQTVDPMPLFTAGGPFDRAAKGGS